MTIAAAHVPARDAAKHLQQLCRPWSHKLDVDLQENAGGVRFPDAVATMTDNEPERTVSVEADREETLGRIKDVVIRI